MFQYEDKDNQQLQPLLFKAMAFTLPSLLSFQKHNNAGLQDHPNYTTNFHKTWHKHYATRDHLNAILSILL
jgi:hypothetical protein